MQTSSYDHRSESSSAVTFRAPADPPRLCSGVRSLVSKARLAANSKTFEDLFATAGESEGGERPVVDLSETGQVLETIPPYFNPGRVEPWILSFPAQFAVEMALDKYEVRSSPSAWNSKESR